MNLLFRGGLLITSVFVVACQTIPTKTKTNINAIYGIPVVTVNFHQAYEPKSKTYHSVEQIREVVAKRMANRFKERGVTIVANGGDVNLFVQLDYVRNFSGQATPWGSDSITRPSYGWVVKAEKSGNLVFEDDKALGPLGANIFENLKTSVTMDLDNDNDTERDYLMKISDSLVERVINLHQQFIN